MEILLWLIFAVVCTFVAVAKNRNPLTWFILGILGGIISLIILAFLPVLKETKECPYCKEKVLTTATVCKHCHHELNTIL